MVDPATNPTAEEERGSLTNPAKSPRESVFEALITYGLTVEEARQEIARREEVAQQMLDSADEATRPAVLKRARAHLFAKGPLHVVPSNRRTPPPATGASLARSPIQSSTTLDAASARTVYEGTVQPARTSPGPPAYAARPSRRPVASSEELTESDQKKTDYSVEAIDLVKVYASGNLKVQALKGISLSVPRGDMVAIMGPSGCGKTTLLNCLSGLDTVDSGVVRVDGRDLADLSDDARSAYRARSMGFVFQFYNLLPVLNAVENIELPLLVSGVPAREARDRALYALELVKLGGSWAGHKPAQLSGGQQQRVAIARALVNDPAIVWADEPTGDLDSKNADEIMDLILGLNRHNGQTFVIVTHDIRVAEKTFRIINILDGAIVSETITESGKTRGHFIHD